MTLVFIAWGHYPGFQDALACARARAGCPIWVVSDGAPPAGVNHLPLSKFPIASRVRCEIAVNTGAWASFSLARWFVLHELITLRPEIKFPIFCADWDVLIFRNLAEAYRPFEKFDYTVSIEGTMESAAYGINHMRPLQSFCELVQKLNYENDPRAKNLNDMEAWSLNRRAHNWNVGNLHEIHDGCVFDHSMHCGADRFMMNGPAKKVLFEKGQPYFVTNDSKIIAANSLHCWGSYKTRTAEVRKMAGIEL